MVCVCVCVSRKIYIEKNPDDNYPKYEKKIQKIISQSQKKNKGKDSFEKQKSNRSMTLLKKSLLKRLIIIIIKLIDLFGLYDLSQKQKMKIKRQTCHQFSK